jgi:hypothetical protein
MAGTQEVGELAANGQYFEIVEDGHHRQLPP